jgi:hypothetical protein
MPRTVDVSFAGGSGQWEGHEINNSLAPIRSLAADLQETLRKPSAERAADFEDDLARGLAVIDSALSSAWLMGPASPHRATATSSISSSSTSSAMAWARPSRPAAASKCWRKLARQVEITVADEGLGVADTHNLFMPFFTTKPNGSGIGLVLSRQICEAHRGTLTLESRSDCRGALARLLLPF